MAFPTSPSNGDQYTRFNILYEYDSSSDTWVAVSYTGSPLGINGTATAWVNFNGTGTVAIRSSYNVSSITDNGSGDYTLTFTSAMVDTDYVIIGSVGQNNSASGNQTTSLRTNTSVSGAATLLTTTQARVLEQGSGGGNNDSSYMFYVVFR